MSFVGEANRIINNLQCESGIRSGYERSWLGQMPYELSSERVAVTESITDRFAI